MDIAAMSMEMHQVDLQSKVGVSVLKMGMDSFENEAADMTKMISEVPAEPNKGINIDATV